MAEQYVYIVKCKELENVFRLTETDDTDTVYKRSCSDAKVLLTVLIHQLSSERITGSNLLHIELDVLKSMVDEWQNKIDAPRRQNQDARIEKFFKECFETVDTSKTAKDAEAAKNAATPFVEIVARYRLWNRETSKTACAELKTFLKTHTFKKTQLFTPGTGESVVAYAGLRMIPLPPFDMNGTSAVLQEFVNQNCVRQVTGRMAIKQLHEKFTEWMKGKGSPDYQLTSGDKKQLRTFFKKECFSTMVHTGSAVHLSAGYFGVCLKGAEAVGRNSKTKKRKAVEQVNAASKEVIETFDSITHAAHECGMSVPSMSLAISTKRTVNGYMYRIVDAEEADAEEVDGEGA